ncbi:tetratricopeptide repeat protein [Nonomuraea rubra]
MTVEADAGEPARRIDTLRRRYELAEAESLAEAAVARHARDATVHLAWGRVLLATHRPQDALKAFRTAAELDPENADAVAWQIAALSRDRNHAEATALWDGARGRFPSGCALRVAMGRVLLDSGRPEEAVRHFDEAAGESCDDSCVTWRAEAMAATRAHADAQALLREFIAGHPGTVKARYGLGRILLDDSRPVEAMECFDAVLERDPDHAGALRRRVSALRDLCRFGEAEAFAETAISRVPRCPDLHTELAWLFSDRGRDDEALTHVDRALAIDPRDAWALYSRVEFLRASRRFEEAEGAAAEAVRLRPDDPDLYTVAAWVLGAQDRDDEALAQVGRALAIDPRDSWALRSRIGLLRQARRFEEAEQAVAEAVRLRPGDPDVYTVAAWVLSAQNREDEALAQVDRALAIDPRDAPALRSRIDFLRYSRRYEEAERAAAEAERLHPHDPATYLTSAAVFGDEEKNEEALEQIERALAIAPHDAGALRSRIDLLRQARRFEEAERAATEAAELVVNDPLFHTTVAWVFSDQDREDEALAQVDRALAIDPRDAPALRSRIDFLRFSRRYEEAERAAAEAVRLQPGDPHVQAAAAWVFSARSQHENALTQIERALAMAPRDPWIVRSRIDLLRRARRYEDAERAVAEAVRLLPDDPDLHTAAAWVFSDQDREDEALAQVDRALAIDPRNSWALRSRIDFLRYSRRYEEAEQAAAEAVRLHPDDCYVHVTAAWVSSARTREDEALAHVDRALAIDSRDSWALRSRIDFLRFARRYKEAEQAAAEAAHHHPDDPYVHTATAWVLSAQDRDDEALAQVDRALAIDPGDSWALRCRMDFLRYCWRYDEAERAAAEAVRLHPADPDVYVTAAWVSSARDRDDEALARVDRALAIDPRNSWALRCRIDFLRYSRRYEEAEQAVAEAVRLQPRDPDLHVTAARVFEDQDRYDDALAHVERALAIDPRDSSAHRRGILVRCHARRFSEAEQAATEAARLCPDDPEVRVATARLFIEQERYEDALTHIDHALAIDPGNAPALLQRVKILRARRSFKEAEKAAAEAIVLRPNRLGIRVELGRVFDDQMKFEQALSCFADALAMDPDHTEAHIARSAALRSSRLCPEAEREIAGLSRSRPQDRFLKAELAWIHHDEKRMGEARRIFEELHASAVGGRERAKAAEGLGWVAFSAHEYATAERHFRAAIDELPGNREYELGLAWALTRQSGRESQEEATGIAHRLTAEGTNASAHVCLGVLSFKSGNLISAEYHLKRALEIDAHHGSHIDLGALYVQMARYPEAEAQLQLAIASKWHESAAHIELGNLYLQWDEDRLPEAEREFRQALAIDAGSGEASIGLAQTLARTGDEAEAERVLRRVLARRDHSDRWRSCTALARLLVQRGDKQQNSDLYAEAYTEAQRAIGLAPNHEADPHFVAGVAHHRLGSLAAEARGRFAYRRRAMHHLRECLRRDPGHVEAQRNLNLLEREIKAAAPAIWGGYAVASISFVLLTIMWTMFFLTSKVTTALLLVNTPILVGLITVSALLPALIRLKLPGFEADLQAGGMSVSLGPTGENTFGPGRFTVTSGPGKLVIAEGPTGQLPRRK